MSGWVERKASRMLVPWDEDTPDARGFWNYVKLHYYRCIELAWEITVMNDGKEGLWDFVFQAVFDKLASPLVYLWENWTVMAPEKKARYSPELARIHEEAKARVEEIFRKYETSSSRRA